MPEPHFRPRHRALLANIRLAGKNLSETNASIYFAELIGLRPARGGAVAAFEAEATVVVAAHVADFRPNKSSKTIYQVL